MRSDLLVIWYGLCAVVGVASAWITGFWLSVALIATLTIVGIVFAEIGDSPKGLPLHHAIFGLAVSVACGHILPLAMFALGSEI